MIRKSLLALAGAATLGLGLSAAPAMAQSGYYPFGGPAYGYRPAHDGYRPWGYGGYRPYAANPYYGPRCWFQPVRFWDGYGWVVQNQRVCR